MRNVWRSGGTLVRLAVGNGGSHLKARVTFKSVEGDVSTMEVNFTAERQ